MIDSKRRMPASHNYDQLRSPFIGRRRTARNSVRLKEGESGSSKNKMPFDITKGYATYEWATPKERTTLQE